LLWLGGFRGFSADLLPSRAAKEEGPHLLAEVRPVPPTGPGPV